MDRAHTVDVKPNVLTGPRDVLKHVGRQYRDPTSVGSKQSGGGLREILEISVQGAARLIDLGIVRRAAAGWIKIGGIADHEINGIVEFELAQILLLDLHRRACRKLERVVAAQLGKTLLPFDQDNAIDVGNQAQSQAHHAATRTQVAYHAVSVWACCCNQPQCIDVEAVAPSTLTNLQCAAKDRVVTQLVAERLSPGHVDSWTAPEKETPAPG